MWPQGVAGGPSIHAIAIPPLGDVLVPAFALGLALVHVVADRLQFLEASPRSRWLSIAGGVSVAYVFVHVLPRVGAAAETIGESETILAALDYHVYVVTLVGFVGFYGLERFATVGFGSTFARAGSIVGRAVDGSGPPTARAASTGVFWIHVGSFAAYNALVGYLLVHPEEPGAASLTFFFVAMALHFLVNDVGLSEHHGRTYRGYGRWVLAAAVFVGVAVGYATPVSEFTLALLFAFLAGGVVLNVIKEELPSERQSRFWAFVVGAGGYSLLLLTV
ncbi:hypothetical protein [Halopiger djelfimassiliensis]|uniref:hypothetical protein n=1 Tax=Halopiger djelfimassiliensis TaxID=1293047 RepID=UPI000677799F|nr:hypothetical protein [Halopiger djelfimassiliensis]